jgi:hypothetical protein
VRFPALNPTHASSSPSPIVQSDLVSELTHRMASQACAEACSGGLSALAGPAFRGCRAVLSASGSVALLSIADPDAGSPMGAVSTLAVGPTLDPDRLGPRPGSHFCTYWRGSSRGW